MKRRTTVERSISMLTPMLPRPPPGGAASATAAVGGGGGPVRVTMTKASPSIGPLASSGPGSPGTHRKANAGRARSSSTVMAPTSPLAMHFPNSNNSSTATANAVASTTAIATNGINVTNVNTRPTPAPIITSPLQPLSPQSGSAGQLSPSPRLVKNMTHLSMLPMPASPASPANFSLPGPSMMPPPQPPSLLLPSQETQNQVQTPWVLSISQQPGQDPRLQQQQQQQQQPIQPSQVPSSAPVMTSSAATVTSLPLAPAIGVIATSAAAMSSQGGSISIASGAITAIPTSVPTSRPSSSSKSSLEPVTPASLMNLSGSESTPTSSPKPSAARIATTAATVTTTAATTKAREVPKNNSPKSGSKGSTQGTGSRRTSTKRQSSGTIAIPLAPRTPGTAAMISPMPPPGGGFALISPALKPTMVPQPARRPAIAPQSALVSPRVHPMLMSPNMVSPNLKPLWPGVSTSEAMARLASKSNYQHILDGDHTALGLSYSSDLHSGIELRRTSHKAAEQKRRDSLKHCFDDLREMIPNIVDKAPSKVFLLKKSFDYICTLKSDIAQRDLRNGELNAQQDCFRASLEAWMATLPESIPRPDLDAWKIPEEEMKARTKPLIDVAKMAAEMAEESAVAVEVARQGTPTGGNKDGKNGHSAKNPNRGTAKDGTGHHLPNKPGNKSKNNSNSTITTTTTAGKGNNSNGTSNDSNDNDEEYDEDDSEDEVDSSIPPSSSTSSPSSSSRANSVSTTGSVRNLMLHKDPSGDVHMSSTGPVIGSKSKATTTTTTTRRGRRAESRSAESEEDDDDEDEDDDEEDDDDNDNDTYEDQEMTDATR
ncbi:MAG: hypothetical protein J3Q66DRAFT_328809 [Benniella sp.]|nr:MAG: hypothetical protein J3Q66DRAFT_328809 [Benniella sp.]